MYKRLYFIGFTAYVAMFVLSLLFYKERTLFNDAAFSLFNILKDGSFCIQHYRFGDVFTQVLPVIAVKTGQPINTVLESYSVGYILCYFLAYLVCGSVLKRYDLALVILLVNILFVADTFYWMLSQLPQAIVLLMVLLAVISNSRLKTIGPLRWGIILLLAITIIFFHPLIVFVLAFVLIYFTLHDNIITDRKLLYSIGAMYVAGVLVKMIFFKDPYEVHSASGLRNIVTLFPDYFRTYANKRFLYNCLVKYYWIPILFVAIVMVYIRRNERRKLVLFATFFAGYLVMVNVLYPNAATPGFYIENLYLPLAVFLALPFVFDVLPLIEKNENAIGVVILIIFSSCARIYATHTAYTERLVLERKYLEEYGDKKIIMKASTADKDKLLLLWGTPYEFLLLSESERGRAASIIIDDDPPGRQWADMQQKSLVVNWAIYPYNKLNKRYFHFTDSTSSYIIGH